MENLEQKSRKIEQIKEEKEIVRNKSIYEGLQLIEDKIYAGGTSIKYWM